MSLADDLLTDCKRWLHIVADDCTSDAELVGRVLPAAIEYVEGQTGLDLPDSASATILATTAVLMCACGMWENRSSASPLTMTAVPHGFGNIITALRQVAL